MVPALGVTCGSMPLAIGCRPVFALAFLPVVRII